MNLANQPSGASINEAASKIKGILSEPPQPTDSPKQETNPGPLSTETKPDPQPKKQAEVSDTEVKSRRRKAKLGDKEIEFDVITEDVDLDLIPKGLMMENDYRQKTMSLADERKAFESSKSEFDAALAELQDMVVVNANALESDEMKELKELDR